MTGSERRARVDGRRGVTGVALLAITGLVVAAGWVTAPVAGRASVAAPPPGLPTPAATTPAVTLGEYQWPLPGPPTVSRPFIPPAAPWLPGHRGVDLAASAGALVFAAGAGVVHFAGPVAGRPVVSVAHPDGLRTTYEPVVATVVVGEPVQAGAPIGVLEAGHPGCSSRACLHWGVRYGEVYLDPLSLLGWGRVRLLPRPAS